MTLSFWGWLWVNGATFKNSEWHTSCKKQSPVSVDFRPVLSLAFCLLLSFFLGPFLLSPIMSKAESGSQGDQLHMAFLSWTRERWLQQCWAAQNLWSVTLFPWVFLSQNLLHLQLSSDYVAKDSPSSSICLSSVTIIGMRCHGRFMWAQGLCVLLTELHLCGMSRPQASQQSPGWVSVVAGR